MRPPRIHDAFELTDRVIVVTGAASGIGQAIAADLATLGVQVVALDVDQGGLTALQARAGGENLLPIPTDVRRRAEVEAAAEEVARRFPRLDGLVNCAGATKRYPAIDFPEGEWDRIIDINLKGTFLCCQAFGRRMVAQGYGRVVNYASVSGLAGHRNSAAYQASKGGVVQLTRALAIEWAPHGVNVNAIAPSTVLTAQQAELQPLDPGLFEELVAKVPLKRAFAPEEMVPSTVFLLSPGSAPITGHILAVDGGYLAQ